MFVKNMYPGAFYCAVRGVLPLCDADLAIVERHADNNIVIYINNKYLLYMIIISSTASQYRVHVWSEYLRRE